jgi:hypothetical protein
MAQLRNKQVLYDSLISFFTPQQIKGGSAGTDASDFVIKSQLDALETIIQNLEWQNSALDYVVDNTLAPATEVLGDRYILSHDGGAPNAAWDGASAGDIVEFDGSVWVATTPTVGTFISADDEGDKLYCWGGAAWVAKYFESTTASTGLVKNTFDIQLADQNQNGIDVTSGTISVDALDGTITVAAGGISVGTITSAKVSDFTSAAETAVFTAANFVDGTTIDFTVTAGDSVTAEVKDNSIDEDHLLNLGTGLANQVLTSDGAGGFSWAADAGSLTEKRAVSASAVTSGNASLSVTDVFGADDPSAKTIPQVFVNGQLVKVTEDLAGSCFFGTSPAAAVAFASLAGTENLYWNGTIEGYDLDASDEVIVHYSVD